MGFGHSEGPVVNYSMYMFMGNEAESWVFMTATTHLMKLYAFLYSDGFTSTWLVSVRVLLAYLVSCFPETGWFSGLFSANTDATIELLVELYPTLLSKHFVNAASATDIDSTDNDYVDDYVDSVNKN